MTALELVNVTKEHSGQPPVVALRSVSLVIDDGELVAVVGPSGSGKSTLLAIAGTLERPTSGLVRIAGVAAEGLSDRQLSGIRGARIGFVFQQFFLIPSLSAVENVACGLLYRGWSPARRKAAAVGALERVGLSARGGHRPGELSGGECQRAAIARALVGGPALILADEPTGSLDSATGAGIMTLLTRLNTEGATIVMVTHNPEVAAAARRRIGLRDGEVVSDSGRPSPSEPKGRGAAWTDERGASATSEEGRRRPKAPRGAAGIYPALRAARLAPAEALRIV